MAALLEVRGREILAEPPQLILGTHPHHLPCRESGLPRATDPQRRGTLWTTTCPQSRRQQSGRLSSTVTSARWSPSSGAPSAAPQVPLPMARHRREMAGPPALRVSPSAREPTAARRSPRQDGARARRRSWSNRCRRSRR
ncbi:hypothetical protein ACFPRL_08250 [Pseudoclavibacter helvolus]